MQLLAPNSRTCEAVNPDRTDPSQESHMVHSLEEHWATQLMKSGMQQVIKQRAIRRLSLSLNKTTQVTRTTSLNRD